MEERGHDIVVTHGNGPQVGDLLLQQEALENGSGRPLDVLGAETQAQIGYGLQRELNTVLEKRAATIVTLTAVDPEDPAFDEPTKPVGPYYEPDEAAALPFPTMQVTTNTGDLKYRRVVPSPEPREILEAEQIRTLVEHDTTVICTGGGGIPVVQENGSIDGVEAVIDKDRGTQVLATEIGADEFLLLTDVDAAYLDFGTPDQRALRSVTASDLREHLDSGEFGVGSMAPKVQAAIRFVENGGERAVITELDKAADAIDGDAGTEVVP
jgi:carbamate kinase